jgi:hypothetical protein
MNVQIYNIRNRIRDYLRNLNDSTKNAAKLLGASIASCIHGIFPSVFKYTTVAICLSVVENDLMHNKIPVVAHASIPDSTHLHDI